MNVKRLNKLANYIERKINKYAQGVDISSNEMGAQSFLLFGNETRKNAFASTLQNLCGKALTDFYMKHNGCGIDAKVWLDVKVAAANSGKLFANAQVVAYPGEGDSTPATSLAEQIRVILIKCAEKAYMTTMGKQLLQVQNELNSKSAFPTNAQKTTPENVYDFQIDRG